MSYIGSTPTTQNFIAGTDSFNGTGSATNFTLSRIVNSVNDIQVVVNNVVQYPPNYSVSGTTLTISPAPSSGTNNVYVRYLSTTLQSVAPSPGTTQQFASGTAANPSITFIGDTNTGIYSPGADTIAFVEGGTEAMRIDSSANVGIGTSSPVAKLDVRGNISIPSANGIVIDGGAAPAANTKYIANGGAYGTNNSMALNVPTGMGFEFAINNVDVANINTSGIFSALATQSAATNGYVKLPSGIYIQWGGANASTAGTTSNFPIAFPSTCWSLVAVNNNQTNPPAPSVTILSASQFRLTVSAGSPNCFYFAIGN